MQQSMGSQSETRLSDWTNKKNSMCLFVYVIIYAYILKYTSYYMLYI